MSLDSSLDSWWGVGAWGQPKVTNIVSMTIHRPKVGVGLNKPNNICFKIEGKCLTNSFSKNQKKKKKCPTHTNAILTFMIYPLKFELQ